MNKFSRHLTSGTIGKLCQCAAWVIAAIGIADIILQTYLIENLIQLVQSSTGLNGTMPPSEIYNLLLSELPNVIMPIISIVFYSVLLYAAGSIINHLFMQKTPVNDDTDEIVIESLDQFSREEIKR